MIIFIYFKLLRMVKYDENLFMKSVIDEYKINVNDDEISDIIFEKHFNKLIEKCNINDIFNYYSNEIDVEDAKQCYGNDYIKIKLGFILHMKVINHLINGTYEEE